jgi:DNA excision repair protein ERCC-4
MVIPIYNNNPRAPMRDNVTRSKTTYSTRNAGGDGTGEESRVRPEFLIFIGRYEIADE